VHEPTSAPSVTRRGVLAGLLSAVVTAPTWGCTDRGSRPLPQHRPDPDAGLRTAVVADKQALLDRYSATVRRHPGLRTRLAPLQADHVAHLQALGGPATPAATATGSPTPTRPAEAVPADPRAAVQLLERTERAAAARRIAQCVRAVDGRLAELIASVGAAEAVHAAVLRPGAR
jgi:hypothetical protein